MNLRQVEEGLGEYCGQLINMQLAGKTNDKKMTKLIDKRRRRVYRDVFDLLGEKNVVLGKKL